MGWGMYRRCMELLDWRWGTSEGGIPTVADLIHEATKRSSEYVQKSIR